MEEKKLNDWAEFKDTVHEIRKKHRYYDHGNRVLFRGQENTTLKTTLERKTSEELTLFEYLIRACRTINEVESITNVKWNTPEFDELFKEIKDKQSLSKFYLPETCYSYLVYLRQHGYPSPLLDWTTSPYIAAYFAMCNTPHEEDVAVYVYIEFVGNIKAVHNPNITTLLPYINTHKRHFAQKACYTVASKWSEESSMHIFCSHHEIFDTTRKSYETPQDILIKITIPAKERSKALKELDKDYNINHFTLFQTEDSLIKALGMRDFDIELE